MADKTITSKTIRTQSGGVIAHTGHRYHVIVRSHEFGNDEYDGTLVMIQPLDPNPIGSRGPLRVFDFLHFEQVDGSVTGGRGARDFTIFSLTPLD